MPRNASNIYAIPPGTEGAPDTTIESNKYNAFIHDIEKDQNDPRPVVAGGTGSTNASAARAALGAEVATAAVSNYSTHVFQAGSFYSLTGATDPPFAGHAFVGICMTSSTDIVLQAIDMTDTLHPIYYRQKIGAAPWSAWANAGAAQFVKKAGDAMTGDLYISKANPFFNLNKQATSGENNIVRGGTLGAGRWDLYLGDAVAEDASNNGSNFALYHRANDATNLGYALYGERATGLLRVKADPTHVLGIATKQYVDGADADKAPITSPTFLVSANAPTPPVLDNDTSIATTAFVKNGVPAPDNPQDLNNLLDPGQYYVPNTATNVPYPGYYWYVRVWRYTDVNNYSFQQAAPLNFSGQAQLWIRAKVIGTWTAWKQYTSGDDWATIAQYVGNTPNKVLNTSSVWGAMVRASLSGPTFSPNFGLAIDFTLNLSNGANTINNAAGAKEGQRGAFVMVTGTGSTLSWGTNYKFPGGFKPVPTPTAGAIDIYSYFCGPTAIYVSAVQDMK